MSELAGIAIIGMHGRFPGADSVEEFWQNLADGRDTISFFSDDELAQAGLDVASLNESGTYVPARGVMRDAECFDRGFFGIHPKEAEVMDPQHRVFLEGCWEALERSGYAPGRINVPVGIYCGATFNTYFMHALNNRPELLELVGRDQVMFGNEKDYIATRTAYKLNLSGPAISLNTACSSSLTAICQACQSLLTYQCDMAIAGGVSVTVPQTRGYHFQEGNIGSPDGHTRTFDADAQGTVFSNGLALLVLKRVDEALADGDQIYGVIKGFAINNDGADRVSFGAPGVDGQAEVVSLAQALAGVEPDEISYVEAHGTATPVGDPIEVAALSDAFRRGTSRKQFCAIGSVKTNVGHLDAASGAAGLIKTALALHHCQIPANPHFRKPNPKLDLENTPFYVNTTLLPWDQDSGRPRCAGVSSFGTGGTNAHVIVEEAPPMEPSGPSRLQQLLLLSAKTPEALNRMRAGLAQHLQSCPEANLADTAFTLQTGRSEFVYRQSVVCSSIQQACSLLESPQPPRALSAEQGHKNPPVVFMFPGQGAQFAGMGADLYKQEIVFRDAVDQCAELLHPILQEDLREILFPTADNEEAANEKIRQTRFTQPALFVVEYALATLWMSWGIQPAALIGHSVGEFVAACLSGVLKLEDALRLIAKRAELVQSMPAGSMLAVRMSASELEPLLDSKLDIAAVNSPALCVVAGPDENIDALENQLSESNIVAKRLQTSHAFHSHMMDPVVGPFAEVLRDVDFAEPTIPYVSTVNADWITPEDAMNPEYWAGHMRKAVQFSDSVEKLLQDPNHVLLEVGPGRSLTQLALQHPSRDKSQRVIASLPHSEEADAPGILAALGALWLAGVDVDWKGFYSNETRRRVVLPTYPFERTRCWPETPVSVDVRATDAYAPTEHSLLAAAPEEPVSTVSAESVTTIARRDRLVDEVKTLLEELSGVDLSAADPSTNLFEFGLDSLLMTQVATLLQKRYRTKISFRQLMDDLTSVEAISAFLDQALPEEAIVAVPTTNAARVAPAVASAATGSEPTIAGQSCVALLEQHLAQTNLLLNELRQQPGDRSSAFAPVRTQVKQRPVDKAPSSHREQPSSHGPFRPFDRNRSHSLSESQQERLNAFIARYNRRTAKSKQLADQNRAVLADPRSVAAFKTAWKEAVYPLHTIRSDGSKIWDVDGNEYVDFVMGFGASLFGHRPPFVVKAVKDQLDAGFETGPIHPMAGEVARLVCELTGAERVGFCSTGSEAVLAAIRVSRTVTARDKIVIFEGSYHGIFDEVLARPTWRNGQRRTMPTAPGIPEGSLGEIIVLEYGNLESLEFIEQYGDEIAAVLVEPVQARRLDLVPRDFLHQLRQITAATGTALVFDEVVTGFRVEPGGAQAYFGIDADLATYGKVVGGGLPIGIVTGKAQFMDALDGGHWQFGDDSTPEVGVTFFAGTFVRHPLALAAAKAVLTHLKEAGPGLQERVAEMASGVAARFRELFDRYQAPFNLCHFSSLIYVSVPQDLTYGGLLFTHLRDRGVHIFEGRVFVFTTAHTEEDVEHLIAAMESSLREMRDDGFLPCADGLVTHANDLSEGPRNRIPLTAAQEEIWLAASISDEVNCSYNQLLRIHFRGELNLQALRDAFSRLLQRHDALRLQIAPTGDSQSVQESLAIEIAIHDLRSESGPERQRTLAELRHGEATTPFDLANGPMLRASLVRLADDENLLLLTVHHIVSDGFSCGILVHELAEFYSAIQEHRPVDMDEVESFVDYALDQANRSGTAEARAVEQYWMDRLDKVPPVLDLPGDHPRPAVKTFSADRVSVRLGEDFVHNLAKVAAQQNCSVFTWLFTAFSVFLERLSGQDDMVLAMVAADQAMTGKHHLVGHAANLLPLRVNVQRDASFLTHLKAVRALTLDAFSNKDITYGSVIKKLHLPRDPSRPPLASIVFNMDPDHAAARFSGLSTEIGTNPRAFENFDWFFNVIRGSDSMELECTFNSDIFEKDTVQRWVRHYEVLLRAAAENPERQLGDLPLLSGPEQQIVLVDWNATQEEYPRETTVQELFEQRVRESPDSVAVVAAEQDFTYEEINRRANRLARYLCDIGVKREELVGIHLDRSEALVVSVLAVLKAGAAYVPLDPFFPADRLTTMADDARLSVVITQESLSENRIAPAASHICIDRDWPAIAQYQESNLDTDVDVRQLAYVIYTSGSTGKPKGVQIPHQALVNLLCSMRKQPGLDPSDTLVSVTTLSFDIAALEIFLPLITGARVVVLAANDTVDGKVLAEQIVKSKATVMQATPATWRLLLDSGWTGKSDLKILCGGEALQRDLAAELLGRCRSLWNMYGPTETTIWSTTTRIMDDSSISIGRPIANTQVYLLDQRMQPVPIGVPGRLYIGGDGLSRGYLNRDELTQEKFVPHPWVDSTRIYDTGDQACWQADGSIKFLGRVDDQVKVRGFRIELGEVEHILATHDAIKECAVVAQRRDSGDQLVAHTVLHPELTATTNELRSHLRTKLPEYMVPSAFVHHESLPETPNGKIDRKALAGIAAVTNATNDYLAPRTETEKLTALIWQQVLEIDRVGLRDNFFDLGGHSLLAMKVIFRIEKEVGIRLSPMDLLVENLERFAAVCDERRESSSPTQLIKPVPRSEMLLPSFGQQRFWFLSQLESDRSAYNVPLAFDLAGPLDVADLEASLDAIVGRHEILRATFVGREGQPYLKFADNLSSNLKVIDVSGEPDPENATRMLVDEDNSRAFDLAVGPIYRFTLIRRGAEDHVLLTVLHHVVADEWSQVIFCNDLIELYAARRESRPPALPELPIQYADFAAWQRGWYEAHGERHLDYWKQQLNDLPTLEIPTDRPRPVTQTFVGRTHCFKISERLVTAIRALGRQEDSTFFMAMLAAFKLLIARYTGEEEVVVGTPSVDRGSADTESLIGLFLNTLVLRTDASGDPNFREFVRRVRQVSLEAFEHQGVPFERLVRALRLKRDLSRNPLFQVLFQLNEAFPDATLGDANMRVYEPENVSAKFDLTLSLVDCADGGLDGRLEYNTDLFDEGSIRAMSERLLVLLEGLVADPDRCVWDVPHLTDSERKQLLLAANETEFDYPNDLCFAQLFERQVETDPNAIAITCAGESLTYGELNERANRVAHGLLSRGVGPNQLIGVKMERGIDMVIAILGIQKSGAAYVPLDPTYPEERIAFIAQDAAIELVLESLDSIVGSATDNPEMAADPSDLAYVIYTSGSTGKPKGVQIDNRALVNFLCSMQRQPGLTKNDVLVAVTTISFDIAGLELFLPLMVGARIVLATDEHVADGRALGELLGKSGATVMQATPATWRLLLDSGFEQPNLKALCGGEKLTRELAEQLIPRCRELWNMYGPTETTIWSLIQKVESGEGFVPIGRPIANTQVYLLDQRMRPVPTGVPGRIYIGGDGLSRGYLNRDELTDEKFVPLPWVDSTGVAAARIYDTGDQACWRLDGSIEFLGRDDDQVKVRGFRIELGEVEHALLSHPNIAGAVAMARNDVGGSANADSSLVAYIIPDGPTPQTSDLREFLGRSLPAYMIPTTIVRLEEFPLTANRKINRRALPVPEIGLASSASHEVPRDNIERQIANIWKKVLNLPSIGLDDDFFDVGGHSLMAARMIYDLEKVYDRRLPLATLLTAPTVRQFAELIRQRDWQPHWQCLVPISESGSNPPLFCIHAAGGNVLLYRDLAKHLGPNQPVYGLQSKGLDGEQSVHTNVEEMAKAYVAEIREIQPSGPYHLGGYCLGGTIAYEVAQQLTAIGEEVAVLALFDTHSRWFDQSLLRRMYLGGQQIAFHAANVILSGPRGVGAFLTEKVSELRRRLGRRFVVTRSRLAFWLGIRKVPPLVMLETVNDQASANYVPAYYPGRLSVFKPRKAYLGYEDPNLGWGDGLARDLEVIELPVFPAGMLIEPFVQELATHLQQLLDQSQKKEIHLRGMIEPIDLGQPNSNLWAAPIES